MVYVSDNSIAYANSIDYAIDMQNSLHSYKFMLDTRQNSKSLIVKRQHFLSDLNLLVRNQHGTILVLCLLTVPTIKVAPLFPASSGLFNFAFAGMGR